MQVKSPLAYVIYVGCRTLAANTPYVPVQKSNMSPIAVLRIRRQWGASQMCKNIFCHCERNEMERSNRKV